MKNYLVNEADTRIELFDDWYYTMAKHGMFAGMVYSYYPEIVKREKLTKEQAYWMAFLNSASQNICTVWVITREFPNLPRTAEEVETFRTWHAENQKDLAYDTDRRYFRTKLVSELEQYLEILDGKTQVELFEGTLVDESPEKYFRNVYNALNSIKGWGRLTTWSATEFYKILGELPIVWDTFFMNDLKGSKSQRNGFLKSMGLDELVWDKRQGNGVETHDGELMYVVEQGAMKVVERLKEKFADEPFFDIIGPETVETAFCSFKNSFFGRRYVTVYADMSYFRIKKAEQTWGDVDFSIFWAIREDKLPKEFAIEFNPKDLEIVSKSLDKGEKGAFFKEKRRKPLLDMISAEQEILNEADWEKAVESGKLKTFMDAAKNLFIAKQNLDDKTLSRTGQYNRMDISGNWNEHSTFEEFEKWIKYRYNRSTPANDKIVEARKELNKIESEFEKLYNYVTVHTAIKANKFFKDIGLGDVESVVKTDVAIVNVDTSLILGAEKEKDVSQD